MTKTIALKLILSLTVGAMTACSDNSPALLEFAEVEQDLGELVAGETISLRFPFKVGDEESYITAMTPSCGCLNPRLELTPGQVTPLGTPMPAGSKGEIVVEFATAGFSGAKRIQLDISGVGPGLPAQVRVKSVLEPWFLVEPLQVKFGPIDPDKPNQLGFVVSGREEFKITRVLGLSDGCQVSGWQAKPTAKHHNLQIELPAGIASQSRAMFLKFFTDKDLEFVVPVSWEIGGDLWVRPERILPLGEMFAGIPAQTSIDIGATRGILATPKWRFEGISGVSADCLTLEEPNTYRLRLKLPGDFPTGPLHGEVVLELSHQVDGQEKNREWRVKLAGIVRPRPQKN